MFSVCMCVCVCVCVCVSGFLEMLTKAQGCRVDDQRGLLTKEQLEVPLFLQLSSDQGLDEASTTTDSPTADSKEDKSSVTPSSAGAAEKTSGSDQSKPKDLRETVLWKTVVQLGWEGGVTDAIRNYDKCLATSCYQSCQRIETCFLLKNGQALFKIVYK